ncbi:MAG: M20/M25/M40 family metallo-hydrolase, partial [Anaeroplasmataceae bacterium]|nr:M20/M25/M40 family metallo-hydrolase [Anaeroplasmataceae bacterium]
PKTVVTESGFLKSRFIDDKGSVCAILGVLKQMAEEHLLPAYDTYVYFVNQEEVGHGAATTDSSISEFVTVDMGCVGKDLAGNEYAVSICAKDSGGPYSYELTTKLIQMAKENNLNYVVDIFPYYGSDIGAAWSSGVDCAGALIGPGVHASHGMERTHLDAIENTMKLLYAYLTTK